MSASLFLQYSAECGSVQGVSALCDIIPFQILHKLRSGMVRPNQDRVGGQPKNHVEVDETWVGGRTRGEGRGVHHKAPASCAIEVRHRKPGTKLDNRKDGRYAGRVRLAVVLDRSAESLCGFVESTVAPGSLIVTDDWSGYAGLGKRDLPLQRAVLPVQRLPLIARHRGRHLCSNLCRALLGRVAAPYM